MAGRGQIIQKDKSVPKSRCRKWEMRYNMGKNPITGKYDQRSRMFHGTYREAQSALRAWILTLREGALTLDEYAKQWIEARPVSSGTKEKNRQQYKAVSMHLGKEKLDELTPAKIEVMERRLLAGKSPSGKPLKPSYVQGIHALLGSMLKDAARDNRIESAAFLMPKTPTGRVKRKEALTSQQVASLMDSMKPDDARHTAVMLSLLAGLRRGECCRSLRWGDVDFSEGLIHVHGTKTAASDDVVPMIPALSMFLYRRERKGEYVVDLAPQSVTEWWYRNRDSMGYPGTTFHTLRHTYITMLARADVHPAVMQRLARHSDSRTTMEVYTHVNMEQQRKAAQALQDSLERHD